MRAMLCRSWDGPAGLEPGEAPPPPLGDGGVRIAVHAAGVNFADTLIVAGKYQERPEFPFSPGIEVAGTVVETAPGVTRCRPGDRVVAVLRHGGYAEEAVATEGGVFVLPEGMDMVTAAGFAVAYGTSHVGLRDRAGLAAGETLVVHGAAGGVGLTAVEIGKVLGATVIATARGADKLAVAEAAGADHLIDYGREDVRERIRALTDGRGADVVYDPVGGDVFDASLRAINWGARLIVVGFASGRIPEIPANRLLIKNAAAIGLLWGMHAYREPDRLERSFAELFEWYAAGRIRPRVAHTLPLERAREALDMLISRRARGKIVLTVRDG